MRHLKHHFQLGVTKSHRQALVANLASQLFTYRKIKTTLVKAKALRSFAERIITLAKDGISTQNRAQQLHYRRLAIKRVRNEQAVKYLFDDLASQFLNRNGGYTRIVKLGNRIGDAAPMALIQLVAEPLEKRRRSDKKLQKLAPQAAKNPEGPSDKDQGVPQSADVRLHNQEETSLP